MAEAGGRGTEKNERQLIRLQHKHPQKSHRKYDFSSSVIVLASRLNLAEHINPMPLSTPF